MKRISLVTRLRRKMAAAIRASQSQYYSSPFVTDGKTARRHRRQAQRQQQLADTEGRNINGLRHRTVALGRPAEGTRKEAVMASITLTTERFVDSDAA